MTDLVPETHMNNFYRETLRNRIFAGTFAEKRHVPEIGGYREIIQVAGFELLLQQDLESLRKHASNLYKSIKWIGITSPMTDCPSTHHCVWTSLDADLPLGTYRFQIRKIRVTDTEISIKLKALGPIDRQLVATTAATKENAPNTPNDWTELLHHWKDSVINGVFWFFATACNLKNTRELLKFLALILCSLAVGSVEAIKFLGNFTIRFMQELAKLYRISMPMLMGILDLISKIIGGFYILIAMIWKDSVHGPRQAPRLQQLDNQQMTPRRYQSIQYTPNNGEPARRVQL